MHSIILAIRNDQRLLKDAREVLAGLDDDSAIRTFRDWLDAIAEVFAAEHPIPWSLFNSAIYTAIQAIPEQEILALPQFQEFTGAVDGNH